MNKHYLVVLGCALLVLFFCMWWISREGKKQAETEDRAYEARRKERIARFQSYTDDQS